MNMEKIIRDINANAEKNSSSGENDYIGENGLRYCGKCHTSKQCEVVFAGRRRIVTCICQCEKERLDKEQQQRENEAAMRRAQEMRKIGFDSADIASWTFENSSGGNEKVMHIMQNYVTNFAEFRESGKGLLLYGGIGTGKTYAAACVANALIDCGVPCCMTNFSRIANKIQGMYEGKQDYIDGLNNFKLLVLDDLAAERKTEYMQEIVFNVIDARYRAGLPMIITTNLTLAEIKSPANLQESRCYDRILERCYPVEVAGASQRRKKIIAEFDETKKLLGI